MSLSEENARLSSELSSLKQNGSVNGMSNGDEIDTQQLQTTIRELTAHVRYSRSYDVLSIFLLPVIRR